MKKNIGVVGKISGNKTVAVYLKVSKFNFKYKLNQTKVAKVLVHDESNELKKGDIVLICACAPKSLKKRFKVIKVLKKYEQTN